MLRQAFLQLAMRRSCEDRLKGGNPVIQEIDSLYYIAVLLLKITSWQMGANQYTTPQYAPVFIVLKS